MIFMDCNLTMPSHLKRLFALPVLLLVLSLVAMMLQACSTNLATGRNQFTGLMSESQEAQVGAQEHEKIIAEFGVYDHPVLNAYVNEIGQKVARYTERPNVTYRFTVLDNPMVNAFALPGGYVYVTRGLIALANNEAELAAVLAHEVGHITGRHSAERYSRGVLTSLGAGILSAAIDQSGVSQALGIGSDLYMKSYSREQENEADTLGIRYLARAGYDPSAMTSFLQSLQAHSALEARLAGKKGGQSPISEYFSTHPATQSRVNKTAQQVADSLGSKQSVLNRSAYLQKINGIVYGDSTKNGFVRGQKFVHPDMGFEFSVPDGFRIINQPAQVVAKSPDGAVILFDMAPNRQGVDPLHYLTQQWMKAEQLISPESITINGLQAATAAFSGRVNGQSVTIRLIVIRFGDDRFVRYQMAIPQNYSAEKLEALKRSSYSFKRLNAQEKAHYKPYRLRTVAVKSGDTLQNLAAQMVYDDFPVERFMILNGLDKSQGLVAGTYYKVVSGR